MKKATLLTLLLIAVNAAGLFTGVLEDAAYRTLMPYSTLSHFIMGLTPLPSDFMQIHKTPILIFKLELLAVSIVILYFMHSHRPPKFLDKVTQKNTLFYLMMLASLAPLWAFTYVPSADGPNRMLEAHIFREYGNPKYGYESFFDKNPRNTTNMLFQLFALLLKPVDILLVEKIFLSIVFVLTPLSVRYFLKAFGETQGKEFISLLFLYTIPLSMGFHNYVAGIPLIFLALGYYLRNLKKPKTKKTINTIILLGLCFITHVFHFLFTATTIIMLKFTEAGRRQKMVLASALVMLAAYSIMITFPVYNILNALNSGETLNIVTNPQLTLKLYKVYRHLIPHSIVGVATVAFLTALLIYNATVTKPDKKNKKYLNMALAFLALYFIIPTDLYKGYVGMRLATPTFLLMLPWIKIRKKDQALLTLLTCIITVSIIANHLYFYERYNKRIDESNSGIRLKKENPKIFPIIRFDKKAYGSIGADPLIFAWSYYLLEKGGVTPFIFASPHHAIVYQDWMTCRDLQCETIPPGYPIPLKDSCRRERFYDYIVSWGVEFPYRVCGNFQLKYWSQGLRIYERI
ncbi:MAG: hypothetical protein ABH834_07950 [Candidatus Altiarchaeota archaeon]